jgi:hypothetical protein
MFPQLILLLAIGSAVACGCMAQTPLKPISVCNLIQNIQHLDGQVVRVRGTLRSTGGSPADSYFDEMVGISCPGIGDATVHIVSPDSHFLAASPRGYRPDFESVRKAEKLIAKAQSEGRSVPKFVATVEGVAVKLVSPEHFGAGRPLPHGHYGADLILAAIRDVTPIR